MSADRLPRIAAPEGDEGSLDPSVYIRGHLPDYGTVLGTFATAAMRQGDLGPKTLELARLRNAAQMQCRLCMSLRRQSAIDGGLDEAAVRVLADRAAGANSLDPLDGVDRTVVELVDAYLTTPGSIPIELADRVRSELAAGEIAQLLLSLVVWTGNRVLVALGLDAPIEPGTLTTFDYLPSGMQQYSRTITEETTDE